MMKVSKDFVFDEKKGKPRKFAYRDVKYDPDKWADANKFLPADFDLVHMKVEGRNKDVSGWIKDQDWEGANFRKEYKVLFWKKYEQFRTHLPD